MYLYRDESNPQNLNFKPGENTNGKTELEHEHVRVGTNTESYNGVSVYGIVFRQASMILMIWRTHKDNALEMEK